MKHGAPELEQKRIADIRKLRYQSGKQDVPPLDGEAALSYRMRCRKIDKGEAWPS